MSKIHVTLPDHLRSDRERLQQAAESIIKDTGMTEVNYKRLYRYGVLSGLVPSDRLDQLQGLGDVKVEIDQVRRASAQ